MSINPKAFIHYQQSSLTKDSRRFFKDYSPKKSTGLKTGRYRTMEFDIKEVIKMDDGKHEGEISKIEYRKEPYEYTDVFVKEKETDLELSYGCPSNVSENTKLGRLLSVFVNLEELKDAGKKVDPEKILVGQKVIFQTITKKTDKGEFCNVVDDSIKKAK